MLKRNLRNRLGLAVISALMAMGLTTSPAQAQITPYVENCFVPATGGMTIRTCGGVEVQLNVVAFLACSYPPSCGFQVNTYFEVRARQRSIPGTRVLSAQAYSMNPGTCSLAPTSTAWTNWCRIGSTGASSPTVRMLSVTAPAL